MTSKRLFQLSLLWIACTIWIVGCGTDTPVSTEPPKETQTQQADTNPQPTPSIRESPTNTPASMSIDTKEETGASIIPDGELSKEGPWWIFTTPQGMWAINPDGTGLKQISWEEFTPQFNHQIAIAPQGGTVAFLSGRDGVHDVILRIIKLPYPTMITEKPLTSEKSEPSEDAMPGDPSFEAVRAMVDIRSMAFSPDGEYLAFMGAIDGPTSDLYVYSMQAMTVTQLTNGPSQGIKPVWSPDGKYIVHAGVSSLGTGAGYGMKGFWAAQADDSGILTLFDPSDTGDQVVVGWANDPTFVVYSWTAVCGPSDLRTFNIETSESRSLWESSFQTVAFHPIEAVALLSSKDDYELCNPESKLGLYLVHSDGSPPLKLLDERAIRVIWSENANLFLVESEFGTLAIDSMGQYIDLDVPAGSTSFPAVAPTTRDLAWIGDGLWVGPLLGTIENPPIKIFNQSTYNATWDPQGEFVLFFSDSGFYIAHKPEFIPLLIAEGFDNRNGFSGWVKP